MKSLLKNNIINAIDLLENNIRYLRLLKIQNSTVESKCIEGLGCSLSDLSNDVSGCKRCRLCEGNDKYFVGEGNPNAKLVFVGEMPVNDENFQIKPISNEQYQLFEKIIKAMGLSKNDIYLANSIKCIIADSGEENLLNAAKSCRSYLLKQLRIIKPKVVCALGEVAARSLLMSDRPLLALRGEFYRINGLLIIPTFSLSHLLSNADDKRLAWEDMQKIMKKLNLNP